MVKQANPRPNEKVKERVMEVLESGRYVKGPQAEEFEIKFQQISGTKYNYTVNSGTSALNLVFTAMEYPLGSEIIVPVNSFMASSNTVETSGYKARFSDVDPFHMNLDPSKLEENISEKTKGILVVHLYGTPAPMDEILEIAEKHDLDIFEDAAQAHGALYKGQKIGSLGLASTFSLFPTKNLSVLGDGGIVCSNDKDLGIKFNALRNAGRLDHPDDAVYFGFNYRLSEILASIGNAMFEDFTKYTQRRQEIASMYTEELEDVGDIILPGILKNTVPVYHQYTIRSNRRNELKNYLKSNNIGSSIKYSIPLHLVTVYRSKYGYSKGDYPVAEKLSQTLLCLPMHPFLENKEINLVISTIKNFFK